jgi:hypothetical protein
VSITPPNVFAPGLPKAMFVAFDGDGKGVAETILDMTRCGGFSLVPVAVSKMASTSFDGCAAIVFPDGIGSVNRDRDAMKFLEKNAAKLKAFRAGGGRILAWGRGAGHLEKSAIPFTCARNGKEAVELLSKWFAKPQDAARADGGNPRGQTPRHKNGNCHP